MDQLQQKGRRLWSPEGVSLYIRFKLSILRRGDELAQCRFTGENDRFDTCTTEFVREETAFPAGANVIRV